MQQICDEGNNYEIISDVYIFAHALMNRFYIVGPVNDGFPRAECGVQLQAWQTLQLSLRVETISQPLPARKKHNFDLILWGDSIFRADRWWEFSMWWML